MLQAGLRIGPYEITGQLGAGGMGVVYRARDERLGREVAVKVLPESFAADADRVRRFEQEARAAAALGHPNILAVFDVGEHEGSPYIVTELLEGETLRERIEAGGLTVRKACELAGQIARGLAAAHDRGIVHRDLKPDNVFLTSDGAIKLLDFGLAKLIEPERDARAGRAGTATTDTATVVGTVGYMSPEQLRAQEVTPATDIFAFGCVLYEMLTGRRAFSGDTSADTMSAILGQDPPPMEATGQTVPRVLQGVVARCLEKNPDERLESAHDLAIELALMAEASFDTAALSESPAAVPKRRGRLRLALAAVGLAVATVGLVGGLLIAQRTSSSRPWPTFKRLSFKRGTVTAARFAPGGGSVVYSAAWDGAPSEVFSVRLERPESRSLGYLEADLLAIAPSSDLALARRRTHVGWDSPATLALAPMSGGTPRDLDEGIAYADIAPNGADMAVVRRTHTGFQLEYPVGTVLLDSGGRLSRPRVSPDGQRVAFVDRLGDAFGLVGAIAVVDRAGKRTTLADGLDEVSGLSWAPGGGEVWFSSRNDTLDSPQLAAVTLDGRKRLLLTSAKRFTLEDVGADGRVLASENDYRARVFYRGAADTADRELSVFDWTVLNSLSVDGKRVGLFESGDTGSTCYVRNTSGAPPVRLGPGVFPSLSPDGRSVVFVRAGSNEARTIVVSPLGPGKETVVSLSEVVVHHAGLLPDGRTLWFWGSAPTGGPRLWLTDLGAAEPRPVTPVGARLAGLMPDGAAAVVGMDDGMWLIPLAGGEPRRLAGIAEGERIAGFTADGLSAYVYSRDLPVRVVRVDLTSGRRERWREIVPADPAGLGTLGPRSVQLIMTPDGVKYAYATMQILSDLYLIEGLK